ncbi:MAG: hypothetical protein H0T44_06325 [Gemmatimonadales bacterium]|nr:hypothetical protein [Gemmatimonadales bacterium]
MESSFGRFQVRIAAGGQSTTLELVHARDVPGPQFRLRKSRLGFRNVGGLSTWFKYKNSIDHGAVPGGFGVNEIGYEHTPAICNDSARCLVQNSSVREPRCNKAASHELLDKAKFQPATRFPQPLRFDPELRND